MGPSWFDFSLASALFGLYECVCNNSLKLYHGEISRLCYIAGHYRTTTCITSSVLISQNGCWGVQQESRCINSVPVYVQILGGCVCACRLFSFLHHSYRPTCGLASMSTCTCVSVCAHMCRWRACVQACRMTFREKWQRQKKHLTHNWSAMKEIR